MCSHYSLLRKTNKKLIALSCFVNVTTLGIKLNNQESYHYLVKIFLVMLLFFALIFSFFWYEYVGIVDSKEAVDVTITYCSMTGGGKVCRSYVKRKNNEELEALSSCYAGYYGKGTLSIGKSILSGETRYYVECFQD